MNSINHPVINDEKYGDFKINTEFYNTFQYKYHFLHSYMIKFNNMPEKLKYLENKTFIAPLKKEQKAILKKIFKEDVINGL